MIGAMCSVKVTFAGSPCGASFGSAARAGVVVPKAQTSAARAPIKSLLIVELLKRRLEGFRFFRDETFKVYRSPWAVEGRRQAVHLGAKLSRAGPLRDGRNDCTSRAASVPRSPGRESPDDLPIPV